MKNWVFKTPKSRWNLRITPVRIGMLVVLAVALVLILARYYAGLGEWSNLNDTMPWGSMDWRRCTDCP